MKYIRYCTYHIHKIYIVINRAIYHYHDNSKTG